MSSLLSLFCVSALSYLFLSSALPTSDHSYVSLAPETNAVELINKGLQAMGRTAAFVAAGAEIVVPEIDRGFCSHIPGIQRVTFDDTHPFALNDTNVQARILWRAGAPHAEGWGYLIASKACPVEHDAVVVFEADVWSPGTNGTRWDMGFARRWLDWLSEDGFSRNAIVTASHGGTDSLETLIELTGEALPVNAGIGRL